MSKIQNIESFTSGLDTFVQSYQDIISVEDKRNISTTLANLKDISTDLNDGLNIEIVKLEEFGNALFILPSLISSISKTLQLSFHSTHYIFWKYIYKTTKNGNHSTYLHLNYNWSFWN